jgi:hypothetical protein
MRVRNNAVYVYHANLLDRCDARTDLKSGDQVRVKNLYGCPPCNTMGHAHVVNVITGEFIGLVHCNSLHTKANYCEYLRRTIARMEQVNEVKNSPVVWASKGGQA